MSVHDETWDKCPHCKQVIKSWHGDFHSQKHCLNFNSWHDFNENFPLKKIISQATGLIQAEKDIPPTQYIPEMISVEKDFLVEDLKNVIEAGLEYAQEQLIRHDESLGRTTRSNKREAEAIEADIQKMKQALEGIKKYE